MGAWRAIIAAGRLVEPALKRYSWCDRCRLDAHVQMLQTEALRSRQETIEKVRGTLERAGIPELKFWTNLSGRTSRILPDISDSRGYQGVVEARMAVFSWETLGHIWNHRFEKLEDEALDRYRSELAARPWILDVFEAIRKKNPAFFFFPYGGPEYCAALGEAAVGLSARIRASGETREGLERAVYEAIKDSVQPPGRGNPGVGFNQEKDDIGIFWAVSTLLALAEVARNPDPDSEEIPASEVPEVTVQDLVLGAEEDIARHHTRFTDNSLARQFGPPTERVILESAERIAREVRATKKPSLIRIALEELRRYRADKNTLTEDEWRALKARLEYRRKMPTEN